MTSVLEIVPIRSAAARQLFASGAHSLVPATSPHFGVHKAENVVEVYGEGPFAPTFDNPGDDPNRAKQK